MVPEGWKLSSVGEHADILTGYAFKSSGYTSDESHIRLLRGDNVGQGTVRWRDVKRWPQHDLSSLHRYKLKLGDFVIALDRTWVASGLKVAEIKSDDTPSLLVQRVARLRAKPSVEQILLKQHFIGHRFEQYVKSVQTETAVPHISPGDIRDYSLLLPPLPEQKKIAEILSTWDKAIETTEKLLASAEAQKRALMQQLLTGKRRLKGFEGSEWHDAAMIEAFDFINGRAFKPKEWGSIGLPIIRIQNLTNSSETLNFFDGDVSEKHRISAGDFLLSWSATLETFIWRGPDAILNQHIFKVEPRRGVDKNFGYHLITHEIWKLKSKVHGTSMKHITKKSLSTVLTKLPTHNEQLAIASVLNEANRTCELLKSNLEGLHNEKRALMQQLLTGKRRVTV